jgi:AAA15 family ATPase/GTPase
MLVEFSVENYRSIKERQTLSLVASPDKTMLESNSFAMPNSKKMRLLTSAAIYGANASGKSNLLQAIQVLRSIVLNSASRMQVGDLFPIQAFLFDGESAQNPTGFEVIFIQDNIRYEYGVSLDKHRVYEEWLLAYPKGRPQTWFSRQYNPENPELKEEADGYEWSFPSLKGEKKRIQQLVRPNALFLSHAAQNNHPQLTEIFHWFSDRLRIINTKISIREYTALLCKNRPGFLEYVLGLILAADSGIDDLLVETKQLPNELKKSIDGLPDVLSEVGLVVQSDFTDQMFKIFQTRVSHDIVTFHKLNNEKSIGLKLEEESEGTQRFFELAGPWLEVLIEGKILLIDELDRSMHPILARELVKMLHNPENNIQNGQLIFTTHDTTLLDSEIFRPDQIWFTEKDKSQTQLYSLLEFRPRKDESLQRGYLLGRYGAIPFINGLNIS